ncbi:hypothetical protein [Gordonia terrae]
MTTTANRDTRRAATKKAPAKKAAAKRAPAKKTAAAKRLEAERAVGAASNTAVDESRAREIDGVVVVPVFFRGDSFWFPQEVQDWPLSVIEAFEEDKAVTALKLLFVDDEDGNSSFELLMSRNYRLRDVEELFALMGQIAGFDEA